VNAPGVAIVMGATGGLGSAIVQRFAGEGWRVVAAGRDRCRVEAVVVRIQSEVADGEVECAEADVVNRAQVDACVELAVTRWGRVDALVNATGGSLAQLSGGPDKLVTRARGRRLRPRHRRQAGVIGLMKGGRPRTWARSTFG
jgi:NAD(P)-dependent dehydrogenase (short-subunit alcohol dehydrogenase family)